MLSQHDFYTHEECRGVCDKVHALRSYWTNRGGGFFPIYTLGSASYLDANNNDDSTYREKAKALNPILTANFPILYERLVNVLSDIFKMPVAYAEGLGYPGFHIFLSSKMFEKPIASTHFDLQFQSIKWNFNDIDFDHPISFTCPFAMPKSGSGLNYWDIREDKNKKISVQELEKLKAAKETLYYPYELGKLVLHRGLILHQIAPSKDIEPDDERITLQGHGLICDGALRIYW